METQEDLDARILQLTKDLNAMQIETVNECTEYIVYGHPSTPVERTYLAYFPDLEKRRQAKSELIRIIGINTRSAKKARKALEIDDCNFSSSPSFTTSDALCMIAGTVIVGATMIGIDNIYKFVTDYFMR